MALLDDLTAQIAAMQQHATDMVTAATTVSAAVGPNAVVATQLAAMNTANDALKVAASGVAVQQVQTPPFD